MRKIAIFIPYYGSFNNYFKLWVQSAGKNTMIDFFLVTDIKIEMELPRNVIKIDKSFLTLKGEIQGLFDFKIVLETPYKLCEYKPVYGMLFAELLSDYEFWGYCDIDLIFGNIADFITERVLEQYDVIFSHGHFMLIRNNQLMNNMYLDEHSPTHYKKAFTSHIVYHFDEWNGVSKIFVKNNIPMYDEVVFSDIRYQWFDFRLAQGDFDGKKRMYVWEDGDLIEYALDKDRTIEIRKVMYIHLQKRNMEWDKKLHKRYIIYPNKIQGSQEEITKDIILKYCKKKKIYWHYIKIRFKYCINKIAKLIVEAFK